MTKNLDQLREVAERATPGTWDVIGGEYVTGVGVVVAPDDGGVGLPDAAHIATFDPPTVLALIERVEAAERDRDTYQTLYEQRAESLEQAEQAVARVVKLLKDCKEVEAVTPSRYDLIWIESVRRALDGGEQQ